MTSTDLKTLLSKAAPGVVSNYEDSAGKVAKKSKYGNSKVTIDGIRFDSIREGKRYQVLLLMERMGLITELKRQVVFQLSVCKYIADACYYENGIYIVEDTKSSKTRKLPVYRLKKKMMENELSIIIKEV